MNQLNNSTQRSSQYTQSGSQSHNADEDRQQTYSATDHDQKIAQLEQTIKSNQFLIFDLKAHIKTLKDRHDTDKKMIEQLKQELDEASSLAAFKASKLEALTSQTIQELKNIYETENKALIERIQTFEKSDTLSAINALGMEIKESLISFSTGLKNNMHYLTHKIELEHLREILGFFDKTEEDISRMIQQHSYLRLTIQNLEQQIKLKDKELTCKKQAESKDKDNEISCLKKIINDLKLDNQRPKKQVRFSGEIRVDENNQKPQKGDYDLKIQLAKMKMARDKALLDYENVLQQLKQTKYLLACFQEQQAGKEFRVTSLNKTLYGVLERVGNEKDISLKAKVLIENTLRNYQVPHHRKSARSCGVSP